MAGNVKCNVFFESNKFKCKVSGLQFKERIFFFQDNRGNLAKNLQMLPFTSTCQLDNVFCVFENLKINQNSVQDYEVWSK